MDSQAIEIQQTTPSSISFEISVNFIKTNANTISNNNGNLLMIFGQNLIFFLLFRVHPEIKNHITIGDSINMALTLDNQSITFNL